METFCSFVSIVNEEQLYGTAPKASYWLLLENRDAWGKNAFKESNIPHWVKDYLSTAIESLPGARIQLIKQTEFSTKPGMAFYVAICKEVESRLYKFNLQGYEDLLNLGFTSLFNDELVYKDFITNQILYLVCTNGKRDTCCAKFGLPVYQALTSIAKEGVWQSTHIGGHRFAGNLLCFPQGICYGRVNQDEVHEIFNAHQKEQVVLEKLRGRVYYEEPIQAADYFLRDNINNRQFNPYYLEGADPLGENSWRVRFMDTEANFKRIVSLTARISDFPVLMSCKDIERKPVTQYYLENIEFIRV